MTPKRKTQNTTSSKTSTPSTSPKTKEKKPGLVEYSTDSHSSEQKFDHDPLKISLPKDSLSKTEEDEHEDSTDGSQEQSNKGPEVVQEGVRVSAIGGKKKKKSSKFSIGFRIDLKWCKKEKWNELLSVIKNQEWEKLVDSCANEGLYEQEMTDFCAKFQNEKGLILSVVEGSIVKFSEETLGNWFGIPTNGYSDYCKGRAKLNVNGDGNAEIVTFFGGKPIDLTIKQNRLTPFHKFLYQFVWRFLLPHPQKRNVVNLMDMSLMYCMAKGIPINFPSLMISHLTHYIHHKLHVGYGNLLTYIFKRCKISLKGEPSFLLTSDNILSSKFLENISLMVTDGVLEKWVQPSLPAEKVQEKRRKVEEVVIEKESEGVKKVRHSQRIATRTPTVTESKPAECINLDDTEGPVPPPKKQVPSAGSSLAAEDIMAVLKESTAKFLTMHEALEKKVDHMGARIEEIRLEILNHIRRSGEAVEDRIERTAAGFTVGRFP